MEYIGLEEDLTEHPRIRPAPAGGVISPGVCVFSGVPLLAPGPASNRGLLVEQNGTRTADPFAHEQHLVIEENGKPLLVTGCAHRGIVNILEHFRTLYSRMPTHVIGGFHLSGRASGSEEDPATVDRIGKYLLKTTAMYYTCHCTGIGPYRRLQATMGTQLGYICRPAACCQSNQKEPTTL